MVQFTSFYDPRDEVDRAGATDQDMMNVYKNFFERPDISEYINKLLNSNVLLNHPIVKNWINNWENWAGGDKSLTPKINNMSDLLNAWRTYNSLDSNYFTGIPNVTKPGQVYESANRQLTPVKFDKSMLKQSWNLPDPYALLDFLEFTGAQVKF